MPDTCEKTPWGEEVPSFSFQTIVMVTPGAHRVHKTPTCSQFMLKVKCGLVNMLDTVGL